MFGLIMTVIILIGITSDGFLCVQDGSNVSVLLNGDVVYADVRRRTSLHIHINAVPQSVRFVTFVLSFTCCFVFHSSLWRWIRRLG
jgi:hypothetical protein